ncbi:MAG: hypothetical protein AAFO89_00750 [Planctomycetota bacterium]
MCLCIGQGSWGLRVLAVLVAALSFAPMASADVDKVNSLLRRAEANLQSVSSSLGNRTTPPRGSAGKLLANRLQQALDDLTPAQELLQSIPAGTSGREEAAARYTAAANEFNRLRAIITGSDAPAEPAPEGVRLNYQQEERLKNATFHIREVEGNAQQLTDATETLRAVGDQLAIDHREVVALRGVVANARRKSGFATENLSQLPSDGRGVAEARQRLVNADAKVVIAADYLNPLHARLQELINPANYPEFNADRDRLRELSQMFNRPGALQTDRAFAADVMQQSEAAKAECMRIAQKYGRLMQQQTDQGKAIEGIGNGFLQNHAEFLLAADAERAALPASIAADLAEARRMAGEAVANQQPGWFNGGIPQVMGFADEKVMLLSVLDPAAGAEQQAALNQAKADLNQQADSLRELIIRENTPPADMFEGPDRERAIETAKSAWSMQQEQYEILGVRIPSENWRRETKWSYSNGTWYLSDRSRLQVRLIVADHENPELAIDRPVNIWKDHQAGDSMIGTPFRAFDEELQPSEYFLRSKLTPSDG